MAEEFWLLGGDERSLYGAEYLEAQGFGAWTYGVPGRKDRQLPPVFERVILPFPSFQDSLLRGHSAIPVEELLCRVGEGTEIFGGLLDPWRKEVEQRGSRVYDLYGQELERKDI